MLNTENKNVYPMEELIKPMLAFKYEDRHFIPGMYVQPKMDGIRALYQNGNFISRDGVLWNTNCLRQHREFLQSFVPPDVILDGELYLHGVSLQQINSRIGVGRKTPHPLEASVPFRIFDVVDISAFPVRYLTFIHNSPLTTTTPLAAAVPTWEVDTLQKADLLYTKCKSLGYEGIMYRNPIEAYAHKGNCKRKDNRSRFLLKRKSHEDLEGIIVGYKQGQDIHGNLKNCLGSFVVQWRDVQFDAGGGLSDLQRLRYWQFKDSMIGKTIRLTYEALSDKGIPLRATIVLVDFHDYPAQ